MTNPPSRLIDETLVLEAQAGNTRALDLLIDKWQGRLYAYAKRFLGKDDDAWDITQDAWMAIANGLAGLKDPAAFPAWVYRILTNKCKDHLHRERRQRILQEQLANENAHNHTIGRHSMDLRDAFQCLSRDMQAILTLRYYEGFAVTEISEILGIAEGTAKSRLHRARMQIKKLLEE